MNCLLDSNIFLEGILLQDRSDEVRAFLTERKNFSLYMSDFSLHSIGYILFRRRNYSAFQEFIDDVVGRIGVVVLRLRPNQLKDTMIVSQQYTLDFDDAYQYTVAEKFDLTIVTFDTDFDRTRRGRVTPGMLLRQRKLHD